MVQPGLGKVVFGNTSKRRSFIHAVAEAQRQNGPDNEGGFLLDGVVGSSRESPEALPGPSSRWKKVRSKRKELRLCMAQDRLKTMPLFTNLEPKVQAELLDAVNFRGAVPRGTVLFRQYDMPGKDDPGEVFIIVSGEVSVWMHPSEEFPAFSNLHDSGEPRSPSSPGPPDSQRRGGALSPGGRRGSVMDARQLILEAQQAAADIDPSKNEPKSHGVQVSSIGAGTLLGHHALIHQEPRNATCIAALDCDLLVIPRLDFLRVLKPALANVKDEKEVFLTAHVPGLGQMAEPELVIPNFTQLFYKKGHVFWQQGLTVEAPVMYVLLKGVVEVRHRRRADEPDRVISTLMPGAVFGACSGQPEPFTVCASSKHACDIYEARDGEYRRMPAFIRKVAEEHLQRTNSLHLQRTWPSEDGPSAMRKKEWWEDEGAQHIFGPRRPMRLSTPSSRGGSCGNSERRKAPPQVRHQLQEAADELVQNPWKAPKNYNGSWKDWTDHGRAHVQQLIFEDMAPLAMEGRLPEYKSLSGWMRRCERTGPPASPPSRHEGSTMRSVGLTSSTMSTSTTESWRPKSSSSSTRPCGSRGQRRKNPSRLGALAASDSALPSALSLGGTGAPGNFTNFAAGAAGGAVAAHRSPPLRTQSATLQAWSA